MQIPAMRPTFIIEFPLEPDRVIDRLTVLLNDRDMPIEGRVAGNHIMLVIPPSRRHFWSPWLNIETGPAETGAQVRGRFSPNPSVWTGFMLTYIAMATLVFFALMFAVSQAVIGNSPWALKLALIPIAISGLMYWASLIGQRIAQQQMHELYNATMAALSDPQSIGEARPNHPEPDTEQSRIVRLPG